MYKLLHMQLSEHLEREAELQAIAEHEYQGCGMRMKEYSISLQVSSWLPSYATLLLFLTSCP
jgi:hypothetical protein